MKKNDLVIVIITVFIAGIFSIFISGQFFSTKDLKKAKTQKISPIESTFQTPDKKYFNDKAINPTQLIKIGNDNNAQPF